MKILKGLLISFLGFLLGLCLAVFGLAYTVHSTVLNPAFLRTEINELDISGLVRDLAAQNSSQPGDNNGISQQEMFTALSDTVTGMEPMIKERISAATDSIYDYLLGKKPNPDLADTLRSSILKTDFITAVIDKIDLGPVIQQVLNEQLSTAPSGYQDDVDTAVTRVVADITPAVKQQIEAAADPMLDYLVGKTDSFTITINVEQLKSSLKTALHDVVFASPPPDLAAVPAAQRETVFNQLFDNFAGGLGTSIQLDQSILGTDARTGLVDGIRQAEDGLAQARQYVAWFQLGYMLLIVLTLVLIAAIVLVYREMRGSTRYLSIVFLSYGVLELAGVLVGRYFAAKELPNAVTDLPAPLQTWMTNLVIRLLAPTATYSIALIVAGVVLLIVSFVYANRKEQTTQVA
ncbi:MAG: hypothetical protein Q7R50_07115 [Dehalococcoidales bacterium]|nr:hypothetical protein [Dehalococcoidales bacterium]